MPSAAFIMVKIWAGAGLSALALTACGGQGAQPSEPAAPAAAPQASASTASAAPKEQAVAEQKPKETAGQKNARRAAERYLDLQPFSRSGLIKQLEFEKYPKADATYGVDSLKTDYNAQAVKAATRYLELQSFSRGSLIQQLTFEGYTKAQAEAGATGAGL